MGFGGWTQFFGQIVITWIIRFRWSAYWLAFEIIVLSPDKWKDPNFRRSEENWKLRNQARWLMAIEIKIWNSPYQAINLISIKDRVGLQPNSNMVSVLNMLLVSRHSKSMTLNHVCTDFKKWKRTSFFGEWKMEIRLIQFYVGSVRLSLEYLIRISFSILAQFLHPSTTFGDCLYHFVLRYVSHFDEVSIVNLLLLDFV